eukprot:11053719-Karenia_brevis.AAC.1
MVRGWSWASWLTYVSSVKSPVGEAMVKMQLAADEKPLLPFAAEKAFWLLKSAFLHRVAKHIQCAVDKKASLFQVLLKLIEHILRCSEEDALDIIAMNRLAAMEAT